MENISRHFAGNWDAAPRVLFGDNDVDKARNALTDRKYFGGQARVLGPHDRTFGYGIVTTLYAQHSEQRMNAASSVFQGRQLTPHKVLVGM